MFGLSLGIVFAIYATLMLILSRAARIKWLCVVAVIYLGIISCICLLLIFDKQLSEFIGGGLLVLVVAGITVDNTWCALWDHYVSSKNRGLKNVTQIIDEVATTKANIYRCLIITGIYVTGYSVFLSAVIRLSP